jgi:hypothetical protein
MGVVTQVRCHAARLPYPLWARRMRWRVLKTCCRRSDGGTRRHALRFHGLPDLPLPIPNPATPTPIHTPRRLLGSTMPNMPAGIAMGVTVLITFELLAGTRRARGRASGAARCGWWTHGLPACGR